MSRLNGDSQTDPSSFLGYRLRLARQAAGYADQGSFARALGFERSYITRVESGNRTPTDDMFIKWCDLCSVSDELRDVLTGLLAVARSTDGPVPTWFEDWLEAERQAATLRVWQPLIVPGLLQTADYARALFIAAGAEGDKADEMVTARLARQAILDRPRPPYMAAVLDESVLYRLVGSPAVMHDQIVRLSELSERPHIMVQVLPASNGANAGLGGALNIASGDGSPDVLLTEAVQDQTSETRSLVRRASDTFDLVRADALPRVASRTLMMEAAEQWKTR
jgi:transcriptional regulator with XRE-family HTH domain